jgi:hypothetical protein
VDGAGSYDDEEALRGVSVGDDGGGGVARGEDGGFRGRRLRDFMLEEVGRRKGIVAADWSRRRGEPVD